MTSILKVDSIQNEVGKEVLKTSGGILQTVYSTSLNNQRTGSVFSSSSSYVNTGISATITPTSSFSKLYVRFTGSLYFFGGTGDDGISCKIYRDGNPINNLTNDMLFYASDPNGASRLINTKISHYVNSNNTIPTTFTLFFSNQWGGVANINYDWSSPNFLIMEVSA